MKNEGDNVRITVTLKRIRVFIVAVEKTLITLCSECNR